MTQIYHDAQAVHLLNHLLAKTAHTIMGIAAAGTIADIIITIMAERDINDATLGEMLHVTDIVLQGEPFSMPSMMLFLPFRLSL